MFYPYLKKMIDSWKLITAHEFLVSKETVVLRRWERSKQKFGFINSFDKTKFLF